MLFGALLILGSGVSDVSGITRQAYLYGGIVCVIFGFLFRFFYMMLK